MDNKDFSDSCKADYTKAETKVPVAKYTGKKASPRKTLRNTLAGTIALTLAAVPLIPAAQALNAADDQSLQVSQGTDYKGSDLVERFKSGSILTLAEIAEIDMDACKAADPQIAAKIIELKATLEAEAEKPVTPDVPTDTITPEPNPEPGNSGDQGENGDGNTDTDVDSGSQNDGADVPTDEQGTPSSPVTPEIPEGEDRDEALLTPIDPFDVLPESMDPYEPSENYPEWSYSGDTDFVTKHYTEDLTTEKFIAVLSEQARQVAGERGLSASAMIAQAVYATDGGRALFSQAPARNLFSSKSCSVSLTPVYDECGTFVKNETSIVFGDEDASQHFDTYLEAFEDYADKLSTLLSIDTNRLTAARETFSEPLDFSKTLEYAQALFGLSDGDVAAIEEIANVYELARFDEPSEDELQNPLEVTRTDAFGHTYREQVSLADLVAEATSHLGVPYVWGGTTTDGFDCSGLVQYSYACALGLSLPRTTYYQCTQGQDVDFDDLRAGDLVFFQKNGVVGHVGMYIGEGCYIEAPAPGQEVKITSMDEKMPHFAKRVLF